MAGLSRTVTGVRCRCRPGTCRHRGERRLPGRPSAGPQDRRCTSTASRTGTRLTQHTCGIIPKASAVRCWTRSSRPIWAVNGASWAAPLTLPGVGRRVPDSTAVRAADRDLEGTPEQGRDDLTQAADPQGHVPTGERHRFGDGYKFANLVTALPCPRVGSTTFPAIIGAAKGDLHPDANAIAASASRSRVSSSDRAGAGGVLPGGRGVHHPGRCAGGRERGQPHVPARVLRSPTHSRRG